LLDEKFDYKSGTRYFPRTESSESNLAPGFFDESRALSFGSLSRTAAPGRAHNFLGHLPPTDAFLARVRLRILPAEGIGDEEWKSDVIFQRIDGFSTETVQAHRHAIDGPRGADALACSRQMRFAELLAHRSALPPVLV